MPVLPFVPLIAGVAGKLIGGKPKTTTEQQQTQDSTTTANYDPAQTEIHAALAEIFKTILSNGPGATNYEKNQAAAPINRGYYDAGNKLEQSLASRGFETSGKLGSTLRGLEIGRINALSTSKAQVNQVAQQRFQDMLRMAQQFTTPTSTTTHGTSSGKSTATGPSGLGDVISGGIGDLASMLLLRNILDKGGSPGGGGFDWGGSNADLYG